MNDVDPIEMTTDIVAAFVSNNSIPKSELPGLIETVHAAVRKLAESPQSEPQAVVETKAPAVSVRKSITPEYLICLEDGAKLKSMKRHLAGLGLTPERYRAKWDLPSDYPMVAPNYAAKRSEMAVKSGLGQKRETAIAASAKVEMIEAPATEAARAQKSKAVTAGRKPGRPRKGA